MDVGICEVVRDEPQVLVALAQHADHEVVARNVNPNLAIGHRA